MAKNISIGKGDFPWKCRGCGKTGVYPLATHYDAQVQHDGKMHDVAIPDLQIPTCNSCKEQVFTEDVHAAIYDALRKHLGLLTPTQIRTAVHRVHLSQKEICERLGVATATMSRWVTGSQIQSKAMDTLLRIFFTFSCVRKITSDKCFVKSVGIQDLDPDGLQELEGAGVSDSSPIELPPNSSVNREKCEHAQKHIQDSHTAWGPPRKVA